MKTSLPIMIIALLIVALSVSLASAHAMIVPPTAQADGSGHFAYDIIIAISEPVEFGWIHWDGTDNTDLGVMWADGFCMDVIQPATWTETIEGNLVDLAVAGSVYYEFGVCDGWVGSGTTTILAPTVGTESATWSSVKGLYR